MDGSTVHRAWRSAVAALLLVAGWVGPATVQAQPAVEVILSKDHDDLKVDRKLLLSVYIGRVKTWPDGQPLRVFTLADDHPLHVQFCRQLLGTYPYVLRNAWNKLVYTGTGFAPTVVANEQEMRRRVEETKGSIGYVGVAQAQMKREPSLARLIPQAYGANK